MCTLLASGCQAVSTRGAIPPVRIDSTRSTVLVNESCTLLIKSQNTLGERPQVEWSTPLGRVAPIKEGMLDFRKDKPAALFVSDKPGVAVVTATLKLDNGETYSDSVRITVNSLQ